MQQKSSLVELWPVQLVSQFGQLAWPSSNGLCVKCMYMMINKNVENSSLMMMVVCLFHFFGFWIIIIIEGKKQQQSSLYKIQSMDFFPEKNCFVFFLEKLFFSFLFGLCNYVIIIRFLFVERCLRINVSRKMKNKKLFFSH